MQNLDELENKAVDPDRLARKAAGEHDRRLRKQYDASADHSSAGGDVSPTQAQAVAEGRTRVVGNVHDNSN